MPDRVVANMAKQRRGGKVFVDWAQNHPTKTTIAAYSLRAMPEPTVSTPVTWDEVEDARTADDLTFTAGDVLARDDDPFAPVAHARAGAARLLREFSADGIVIDDARLAVIRPQGRPPGTGRCRRARSTPASAVSTPPSARCARRPGWWPSRCGSWSP